MNPLRLRELVEGVSDLLWSCVAAFIVRLVGTMAVGAFRRCLTTLYIVVLVSDTACSACFRRSASDWWVKKPVNQVLTRQKHPWSSLPYGAISDFLVRGATPSA